MLSFLVFGTGFIVRPIGGILFGAYADKRGRTKALSATIMLMGVCTLLMGLLPTYSQIGIAAPLMLTVLRLAQGIATGGEFGTAVTFIAEYGTPKNRAFVISWQSFSTSFGLLMGSTTGLIASLSMSQEALYSWGWRIPFISGILIAFYGAYVRKSVAETPVFEAEMRNKKEKDHTPVSELFLSYKRSIFTVMGLLVGSSATYYILITYMPTYISQFLHSSLSSAFIVNTTVIAIYLTFSPFVGKLLDKIGIRTGLIIGCLGFIILTYPVFYILTKSDSPVIMIALLVVLVIFQAINAIAIMVASAEVFPTKLRNSGIGFAYNISAAIFGGMAPLAATWLIKVTGDRLSIVYLIVGCILITLLTTLCLYKDPKKP